MAKYLRVSAWCTAALSLFVLWQIFDYIRVSDSNHTSFEPWLLLLFFVPTALTGVLAIKLRGAIVAGILAITMGLLGVASLIYIDRTNTMLQYERWLDRGMPLPRR